MLAGDRGGLWGSGFGAWWGEFRDAVRTKHALYWVEYLEAAVADAGGTL